MKPLLKGIYHSLETCRGSCYTDGWNFQGKKIKHQSLGGELSNQILHGKRDSIQVISPPHGIVNPPKTVKSVPKMKIDIYALRRLMGSKYVVKKLVRGIKIMVVCYGFGDSSGRF